MPIENHTEEDAADKVVSSSDDTSSTAVQSPQPVPLVMELALMQTLTMMQQFDLADPESCTKVTAKVRQKWERGEGADPIDVLTRMRAAEGAMLDSMVEMASMKMARSLPEVPARVPFVSRMIPPNGFYDKMPEIAHLCKLMQVPVAFAEDLDVIGLASINPYFADALATEIQQEFAKESTIQPIISIVRLDRISWMKMCEKHFR